MAIKILPEKPTICASIMAHTVEEFLEVVRKVEGTDVIEIRADGLKIEGRDVGKKYAAEIKRLMRNVKNQTKLPTILTVRAEKEGGVFTGKESDRVTCIMGALELTDAIDIELHMKIGRDELIKEAKKKNKIVIVSCHDLSATPGDDTMHKILEEECHAGADVAKLAVKANSRKDVMRLLNVTQAMSSLLEIPICTLSMGELGKISRIAAPFFGSALTYGYVTRETSPGQLSVKELKTALEILGLRK